MPAPSTSAQARMVRSSTRDKKGARSRSQTPLVDVWDIKHELPSQDRARVWEPPVVGTIKPPKQPKTRKEGKKVSKEGKPGKEGKKRLSRGVVDWFDRGLDPRGPSKRGESSKGKGKGKAKERGRGIAADEPPFPPGEEIELPPPSQYRPELWEDENGAGPSGTTGYRMSDSESETDSDRPPLELDKKGRSLGPIQSRHDLHIKRHALFDNHLMPQHWRYEDSMDIDEPPDVPIPAHYALIADDLPEDDKDDPDYREDGGRNVPLSEVKMPPMSFKHFENSLLPEVLQMGDPATAGALVKNRSQLKLPTRARRYQSFSPPRRDSPTPIPTPTAEELGRLWPRHATLEFPSKNASVYNRFVDLLRHQAKEEDLSFVCVPDPEQYLDDPSTDEGETDTDPIDSPHLYARHSRGQALVTTVPTSNTEVAPPAPTAISALSRRGSVMSLQPAMGVRSLTPIVLEPARIIERGRTPEPLRAVDESDHKPFPWELFPHLEPYREHSRIPEGKPVLPVEVKPAIKFDDKPASQRSQRAKTASQNVKPSSSHRDLPRLSQMLSQEDTKPNTQELIEADLRRRPSQRSQAPGPSQRVKTESQRGRTETPALRSVDSDTEESKPNPPKELEPELVTFKHKLTSLFPRFDSGGLIDTAFAQLEAERGKSYVNDLVDDHKPFPKTPKGNRLDALSENAQEVLTAKLDDPVAKIPPRVLKRSAARIEQAMCTVFATLMAQRMRVVGTQRRKMRKSRWGDVMAAAAVTLPPEIARPAAKVMRAKLGAVKVRAPSPAEFERRFDDLALLDEMPGNDSWKDLTANVLSIPSLARWNEGDWSHGEMPPPKRRKHQSAAETALRAELKEGTRRRKEARKAEDAEWDLRLADMRAQRKEEHESAKAAKRKRAAERVAEWRRLWNERKAARDAAEAAAAAAAAAEEAAERAKEEEKEAARRKRLAATPQKSPGKSVLRSGGERRERRLSVRWRSGSPEAAPPPKEWPLRQKDGTPVRRSSRRRSSETPVVEVEILVSGAEDEEDYKDEDAKEDEDKDDE